MVCLMWILLRGLIFKRLKVLNGLMSHLQQNKKWVNIALKKIENDLYQ